MHLDFFKISITYMYYYDNLDNGKKSIPTDESPNYYNVVLLRKLLTTITNSNRFTEKI